VSTTRLEAFSDGVIAVAITLLVLNIDLPDLKPGQSLAGGLIAQWRQILLRSIAGVLPYVIATVLAVVSSYLTLAICGAIAVFYAFPVGSGGGV
jgi:Endosomal/lysosomal potassium channel TMEM175